MVLKRPVLLKLQLKISDATALRLPDQRTRKQKRQQQNSSAQPFAVEQAVAADAQPSAAHGTAANGQQRQVSIELFGRSDILTNQVHLPLTSCHLSFVSSRPYVGRKFFEWTRSDVSGPNR